MRAPHAHTCPNAHTRPSPTRVPLGSVSFKVGAGEEYSVNIGMTEGARFEFQFRSDLDIDVKLLGPFDNNIGNWPRVESLTADIVAEVTGVHTLVFDNSFSLITGKLVNLTYRVVPPGGR